MSYLDLYTNPSSIIISSLLSFEKLDGGKFIAYAGREMSIRELLDDIILDKKPYVNLIGLGRKVSSQDVIRRGEVIIVNPNTGRITVMPQQRASSGRYFNRPVDSNSLKKFEEIIIEQLEHYSTTGGRKYGALEAAKKANIMSTLTSKKYALHILTNIFRSSTKAQIIYDLTFGKVTSSYHNIRRKCERANAELLTTPDEWFYILQNRGSTKPAELSVKIKYKKCGHETFKIIHNIGRRGCGVCSIEKNLQNLQGKLTYEHAMTLAQLRGLELLSTKDDFKIAVAKARGEGKKNSDVILKWKCKECDHEFFNRYSNIKWHGTDCPLCNTGKEQRITHKICEHIFGEYLSSDKSFIVGKSIIEIFEVEDLPKSLRHPNVHVDIYAVLQIGDKKIVLAIEYNGQQHEDSKQGWKAYQWVSHGNTYDEWRNLVQRDKNKVLQFKRYNSDGYYLIVVPHTVKRNQRLDYIVKEFERQSGINLENIEYTDWQNLYYQKKD